MKRRSRHMLSILLTAVLAMLATGTPAVPVTVHAAQTRPAFQVDFIDVGQGDAALVQCDGHYMLIDGGPSKKSSLIYSYLKQRSITHLDYMVATHPDADHIGGLSGALNYATVGVAFSPVTTHDTKTFQSFVKYLTLQNVSVTVPAAGDTFLLGSATVTVLGPTRTAADSNDNSIVLRIVYGSTSFLFTGDAQDAEEKDILGSKQTVGSTVLKVAHHGSKSSTGYQFLRMVAPQYAVLSVGAGNTYGHPTEEVLSRLRDAGVQTYRTDLQGHIICVSDGVSVTFIPQKNAGANTLEGAGAGQNAAGSGSQSPVAQQQGTTAATPKTASSATKSAAASESAVQASVAPAVQATDAPAEMPTGITYVLNKNSHKFHSAGCSSVKQMSEKNKVYFTGSREEAIAQGYEPCGNCRP